MSDDQTPDVPVYAPSIGSEPGLEDGENRTELGQCQCAEHADPSDGVCRRCQQPVGDVAAEPEPLAPEPEAAV